MATPYLIVHCQIPSWVNLFSIKVNAVEDFVTVVPRGWPWLTTGLACTALPAVLLG